MFWFSTIFESTVEDSRDCLLGRHVYVLDGSQNKSNGSIVISRTSKIPIRDILVSQLEVKASSQAWCSS